MPNTSIRISIGFSAHRLPSPYIHNPPLTHLRIFIYTPRTFTHISHTSLTFLPSLTWFAGAVEQPSDASGRRLRRVRSVPRGLLLGRRRARWVPAQGAVYRWVWPVEGWWVNVLDLARFTRGSVLYWKWGVIYAFTSELDSNTGGRGRGKMANIWGGKLIFVPYQWFSQEPGITCRRFFKYFLEFRS